MTSTEDKTGSFPFKISLYVSLIAVSLAIIHQVSSSYVDTVTILLVVAIIVVWLPNLKSIEFPGGAKLELDRLEEAAEEVIGNKTPEIEENENIPIYEQVFEINPNLSLVYFRIEIELRIMKLAEIHKIAYKRSLRRTLNELSNNGILPPEVSAHGLYELINFGNMAAHGIEVPPEAAEYMLDAGPKIMAILDEILANTSQLHNSDSTISQ